MIQRITLLGAGNLAVQLGKTLLWSGFDILQVYSRTAESARSLASLLETGWTTDLQKIDLSADMLIISIKDDAIESVLNQIKHADTLIVHTSGSIAMNILAKYTNAYGVFYPLQTFSKTRDVDFSDIPLCLEASSEAVMTKLKNFAAKLSNHVEEINSEKRMILHVAAVFACNFVNHCYYLGSRILENEGLSLDLLKPLIRETAEKLMEMNPFDAQTGPAKRNDMFVIDKHLNLIENQKVADIYKILTESIYKTHSL